MLEEGVQYLEHNKKCPKHHVEHTGSNVYLLDFYTALGRIEDGKKHINYLLEKIVLDNGASVFHPGRLNQMNMSNNVIDSGSAVDTIARFANTHRGSFSDVEHQRIAGDLTRVVTTYLAEASVSKPITNQRLWGLTGVASYIAYTGDRSYVSFLDSSIEKAFADMTEDGFFRYYPDAEAHGAFSGYDDMTTFYQSRHIAFIRYALSVVGVSSEGYEQRLHKSEQALLSMYKEDGTKDLKMECKRWYWLSEYEVASHSFDLYALVHSNVVGHEPAFRNALYQLRRHFTGGYLHASMGTDVNFQCPIFWTAHLAWITRITNIKELFDNCEELTDFSFRFLGKEVITDTAPGKRALINTRPRKRNPTVGLCENGLQDAKPIWNLSLPTLPPSLWFSIRENLNHSWYALRGLRVREATARIFLMLRETVVMVLPRYTSSYGQISNFNYSKGEDGSVTVELDIRPGTKYGSVLPVTKKLTVLLSAQ